MSRIRATDDRISFEVDRVGVPVVVKTSYFPNWQADGAEGPWRVTPNRMVVVPTSKRVSLNYGTTPVDYLGNFATLLGFAGLFLLWRFPRRPGDDKPDEDEKPKAEPVDEDEWLRELAAVGGSPT